MKTYKVYTNLKGNNEAVEMGWSWPAFFFTWIWALGKKIWMLTTLSLSALVMSVVFSFLLLAVVPEFSLKLSPELFLIYAGYFVLSFSALMGLNGNQWHEDKLLTLGYRFRAVIVASNSKEAVATYAKEKHHQYFLTA